MSLFKNSNPRRNGNQAESYSDPDKMDIDVCTTVPPSPSSPPPFITSLSTQDSKPCRLRYVLCLTWVTSVLVYTSIRTTSSVDIVKMLAWWHRDDFILSLHFSLSKLFLHGYFGTARWKASTNNVSGVGYSGDTHMGWVISMCVVPCILICGAGRILDWKL
ncbi:hypothetical protein FPCIR_5919 [Fusarium pseudocircinatum]|uniref:Uncharacterized protein n=1 Tax=Fusarium pseudocircinatum TaxID=56676 RepID=A0A8H5P843_9HYPO|nr:hypothetical protein FPCIR_5919 [Fusarium pseudocircinatum]